MRILLFGDGAWAVNSLERLVQEEWTLIGLVVRTKPTVQTLLDKANDLNLPILQVKNVNDPEFIKKVVAMHPDLNLSISYDQILTSDILKTAHLGFVNFHAGKLPCYRGRNVINWAIINGETEIGITAHYVDEGIDTGDIITQKTIPVAWMDTYGDVLQNVIDAFPDLVSETVALIANGGVNRQPQNLDIGTYFARRDNGDEWLDWSDTSLKLYNKIRAITRPGPGARTLLGNQVVIVWRATYDPSWPNSIATPGQVVGRHAEEGVMVKTGDSMILIQEVQVSDSGVHVPGWRIGTRLGVNILSKLRDLEARVENLEKRIQSLNPRRKNV